MGLEPILLEAPLRAILNRLLRTLRTTVEWDELLVEFFVSADEWLINAILLILPDMLQRALIVLALADVNHFIIRGHWYLVEMCANGNCCGIHHCRVVETTL